MRDAQGLTARPSEVPTPAPPAGSVEAGGTGERAAGRAGERPGPAVPSWAAPRTLGPERRVLRRLVVLLTASIFCADLLLPPGVGASGLYIVPVLLSLWGNDRRTTLFVAGGCAALAVVGAVLPLPPASARFHLLADRIVTLFAIWITARLGLMRRGIEEELRKSREVTATTLASIADAVITTDREGRVSFVNDAATALTGWTSAEAAGRRLGQVFRRFDRGADERPVPPLEELAPADGEAVLVQRDGTCVPVETSTAPIRPSDEQGDEELGQVLVFRDITARKREQERVEGLAYRDGLTGLANRVSFLDRLALELAHEKRRGGCLAVLYLDLDGFKGINDAHGHAAGDALLMAVGRRLTSSLRAGDTVARLGGDEFTVLLPDVGGAEHARAVVQKLLERLLLPYQLEGRELRAPPSLGVALYPRDGLDGDALLRRADRAMYAAKNAGGARAAGLARADPPARSERP